MSVKKKLSDCKEGFYAWLKYLSLQSGQILDSFGGGANNCRFGFSQKNSF